jgi:HD domain
MIRDRLRQFREAIVEPSPEDYALARNHLPGALFALFAAQQSRDIAHSAGTARWLIERGHSDPDLLAAALLHDIGKGEQRRWDRVAYVLASAAHVDGQLAASRSRLAVRRAIARSRAHAVTSADLMAAAGAGPRAIELTRRHHEPAAGDGVLALLQVADVAN